MVNLLEYVKRQFKSHSNSQKEQIIDERVKVETLSISKNIIATGFFSDNTITCTESRETTNIHGKNILLGDRSQAIGIYRPGEETQRSTIVKSGNKQVSVTLENDSIAVVELNEEKNSADQPITINVNTSRVYELAQKPFKPNVTIEGDLPVKSITTPEGSLVRFTLGNKKEYLFYNDIERFSFNPEKFSNLGQKLWDKLSVEKNIKFESDEIKWLKLYCCMNREQIHSFITQNFCELSKSSVLKALGANFFEVKDICKNLSPPEGETMSPLVGLLTNEYSPDVNYNIKFYLSTDDYF